MCTIENKFCYIKFKLGLCLCGASLAASFTSASSTSPSGAGDGVRFSPPAFSTLDSISGRPTPLSFNLRTSVNPHRGQAGA